MIATHGGSAANERAMSYDPRSYWNARFRKYGHTGEVDPVIYAYDQGQRLRAIDRALTRDGVRVDGGRALDVGCGSGDVIELLLRRGAREVTGIDCSEGVVAHARERFAAAGHRVKLEVGLLEDAALPAGVFDVVTSVNLLQHVTGEPELRNVVTALVSALAPTGHLVLLEFSPSRVRVRRPSDYLVVRPRAEYVAVVEAAGCRLAAELPLPRLGVRMCRAVRRAGEAVRRRRIRDKADRKAVGAAPSVTDARLYSIVRGAILALARPIDESSLRVPRGATDMRILLFAKV